MCLAIPGKIISIDTAHELKMATVDFHGVSKEICIEWIDAGIGDYILAHAGVALTTLDEAEATATLQDFDALAKYNDTAPDAPSALLRLS